MADHSGGQQPVPWRLTDVVMATVVVFASFLVTILLLGVVVEAVGLEERTLLTPWFIGIFEGLMLGAAWVFGIRKYRAHWETLGLRQPIARLSFMLPWLALLGSLGFTAIYAAIINALGIDSLLPPSIPEDVLGSGLQRLLNALVIGLWGPFTEEVFFRGFVLAGLIAPLGVTRAAAVSAAIFAIAHLTLGTLIPIFVTGLFLAWLYIRTRSIWPPVMAHAAQNLLALTVAQ